MASNIFWTQQARDDLRAIRAHIARDAPATATAYVQKLRASVERLSLFPFSGQVVPEFKQEELREILQGNYRLIYRVKQNHIDIVAVLHNARILDESDG